MTNSAQLILGIIHDSKYNVDTACTQKPVFQTARFMISMRKPARIATLVLHVKGATLSGSHTNIFQQTDFTPEIIHKYRQLGLSPILPDIRNNYLNACMVSATPSAPTHVHACTLPPQCFHMCVHACTLHPQCCPHVWFVSMCFREVPTQHYNMRDL